MVKVSHSPTAINQNSSQHLFELLLWHKLIENTLLVFLTFSLCHTKHSKKPYLQCPRQTEMQPCLVFNQTCTTDFHERQLFPPSCGHRRQSGRHQAQTFWSSCTHHQGPTSPGCLPHTLPPKHLSLSPHLGDVETTYFLFDYLENKRQQPFPSHTDTDRPGPEQT